VSQHPPVLLYAECSGKLLFVPKASAKELARI
jgi:hypothetical protein